MRDYTDEMYAVNHGLARRRVEITVKEHMKDRWQMDIPCEHNRGRKKQRKDENLEFFLVIQMFGDLKLRVA